MYFKRKIILFTFTLVVANAGQALPRYDADDVKKFKETNECVSCNLTNTRFWDDHRKANLQHANISGAGFHGDNTKSNYSNANCIKTHFSDGSEAKFNSAILIDADFSGNFTNADFTNANLRGANLANTNLFGATLSDKQLKEASTVCNAILPDGSKGICK